MLKLKFWNYVYFYDKKASFTFTFTFLLKAKLENEAKLHFCILSVPTWLLRDNFSFAFHFTFFEMLHLKALFIRWTWSKYPWLWQLVSNFHYTQTTFNIYRLNYIYLFCT
jgi:hypothetical protein